MDITRHHNLRFAAGALAAALAASLIVGCGGAAAPHLEGADTSTPVADVARPTSTVPPAAPVTVPPSSSTLVDHAVSTTVAGENPAGRPAAMRAVSVVGELDVLDRPAGVPLTVLGSHTDFGTPLVLGVLSTVPDVADGAGTEPGLEVHGAEWVEVLVPERPNDLRGWVRAADVRLETLDVEIHVDLAERTLRLYEVGELVDEWTVAIGRPDRPTPAGTYFITDKLATEDPAGVFGPYALGVSAFSDVLFDFIGGVGQVGIHGTNDPGSIGDAVSSGCIRLPNDVIAALVDRVPVGTPVHIW